MQKIRIQDVWHQVGRCGLQLQYIIKCLDFFLEICKARLVFFWPSFFRRCLKLRNGNTSGNNSITSAPKETECIELTTTIGNMVRSKGIRRYLGRAFQIMPKFKIHYSDKCIYLSLLFVVKLPLFPAQWELRGWTILPTI